MKPQLKEDRFDAVEAGPAMRSHVSTQRGRHAVLGVGWSALNTGSAMLISIIVFIITSRLLGPEEFGIVALGISIVTFVGCATPGGFGEAIVQRAEIGEAHLDTVFWVCVGSGLALFLPILIFADDVARLAGEPVLAQLLPFFGVKLILDLAAVVPQALVVRAMQFKHVAARTVIGNSFGGIACVAMVLNGYGLWALAMAPMITSVVSLVVLVRAARWLPGLDVRQSALRDLLRFGLFASGTNALHLLNIDRLVLGFMAGPAVLGLYFLGKRLFDLLSGVTAGAIYPVTTVFFASIQKEPEKHVDAYRNALRATAIVAFPIFGGLLSVSESAVPLILGSHWTPALPAVQAFAMIGLFGGLMIPSSSLTNGLGRADLSLAIDSLRNLLAVGSIILFVHSGFEAAMRALVVAHAIMLPSGFLIARKLINISLKQYLEALVPPVVATLAMCAAILAVPVAALHLQPIPLFLTQVVLGATVYVAVTLSLSGRQIAELRQTFARRAAGE
jgi:O-antigen/teichoic acid export membrane protein